MNGHEFPLDVRQEVMEALCQHLGVDKAPPPGENPEETRARRIIQVVLHLRESNGHERQLNEWDERDLVGVGKSAETIFRSIEKSASRDAGYQPSGEVLYILSFHRENRPYSSRFTFKLWGGLESQNLATTNHHHRGLAMSGGQDQSTVAERLMPEFLKFVVAKEQNLISERELVQKQSAHVFDVLVKQNASLSSVITDYTEREMKVRQIELAQDDQAYDREKKRKEEESSEKMKEAVWTAIKENVLPALPTMLPQILSALRGQGAGGGGFGGGFGGFGGDPSESPDFDEWYARQTKGEPAKAQAHKASNGKSKAKSSGDAKVEVSGEKKEEKTEKKEEKTEKKDDEKLAGPSFLDKFRLRVALETSRFVMFIKGRGKFEAFKKALSGVASKIFDDIVVLSESESLDGEEDSKRLAELALMLGASVQNDQVMGLAAYMSLDNMGKVSLEELVGLLQTYGERLQQAQQAFEKEPAPAE